MGAAIGRRIFGDGHDGPIHIGRFRILARIGGGGMGTVFRAHDPELDRLVAVKVLRTNLLHDAVAGVRRLQREAIAMARLSHPNVVTVYEVGTSDGQMFFAMELVEGVDLSRWMHDHATTGAARLSAAMEVLLQAGRGLAAAHSAGLVHRDFKPSNVLLGDDGRVRVADFGLVLALAEPAETEVGDEQPADAAVPRTGPRSRTKTTRADARLGTPRYMSPEQRDGATVDARSDQFSFCVTAWELLFGCLPWADTDDGEVVPPVGAPRWIVAALTRGLQDDPSGRHPDMRALLAALSADPRRRRRRWAAAGLALTLVGTAGAAYARHRATLCDDGPDALAQTWNENRRALLADHVAGLELAGTETWIRAEARMQEFANEWLKTWDDVCDAGRRRGEIAAASLHAALGCLQVRRLDLEAALTVLETGDRLTAAHAVDLAYALRRPSACAEAGAIADAVPLPEDPGDAEAVLRLGRQLAVARTTGVAGDWRQTIEQIDAIEGDLEALGYEPLGLRAAALRVEASQGLEREEESERIAEAAYWRAVRGGDDGMAASFARVLADCAARRGDVSGGETWMDYAWAFSERARVDDAERARLELTHARVRVQAGDLATARDALDRALVLGESAWGSRHPQTWPVYAFLSVVSRLMRSDAEAEDFAREAVAIVEEAYGPRALAASPTTGALAAALSVSGKHDEALALSQSSLETAVAWLGPGHATVGRALNDLGATASRAGQHTLAVEAFRLGCAILDAHADPRDDGRLLARYNLAQALYLVGRSEEALLNAREAVRAYEAARGPDHPRVAMALRGVGLIHYRRGEFHEAREPLKRAFAIYERTLGASHPEALTIRLAEIRIELELGDPRVAARLAEQLARDTRGPEAAVEHHSTLILLGIVWERIGRLALAEVVLAENRAP